MPVAAAFCGGGFPLGLLKASRRLGSSSLVSSESDVPSSSSLELPSLPSLSLQASLWVSLRPERREAEPGLAAGGPPKNAELPCRAQPPAAGGGGGLVSRADAAAGAEACAAPPRADWDEAEAAPGPALQAVRALWLRALCAAASASAAATNRQIRAKSQINLISLIYLTLYEEPSA